MVDESFHSGLSYSLDVNIKRACDEYGLTAPVGGHWQVGIVLNSMGEVTLPDLKESSYSSLCILFPP